MFAFFKKRKRSQGMNAVVLSDEGIAHACIAHFDDKLPTLQALDYSPIKHKAETLFALKKLILKNKLEHVSIVTSLLIADSHLVMLERPDVADNELAQAVRWSIKDTLPFNIEDAIIDVFDIPEKKEGGRAPLVYVSAAEKNFLKKRIQMLEELGLEIQSIDVAELVLRNVATLLPEDDDGVVLLKLDATQGLMTLTQHSSLYLARNIDTGYSALIAPISTNKGEAENSTGLALNGISPEQQRSLDTIVLEVQRSLDYYESHFAKPPINSLVIAPLGHDIPNIVKYLSDALGLQVRMFDFNSVLDTPELISAEMQAKCFFAIGAALRETAEALYNEKQSHNKGAAA